MRAGVRPLDPKAPRRILVRAVNWVGDAVMTLPALTALAAACPQARIEVLAKPWVAPVYAPHPAVAEVVAFEARGAHAGPAGLLRLAGELRARRYDWAVLFQNAFQAALLARVARVPVRLGFAADGRGLLLSHQVPRGAAVRAAHQSSYYLHILAGAGLPVAPPPPEGVSPRLHLAPEDVRAATDLLAAEGLAEAGPLLGLAPGAAYGPAKCWPAERFAAAAAALLDQGFAAALLLGSAGEAPACAAVARGLAGRRVLNLAGRTGLGPALAVIARLGLMLSNDSGLMHAAAALAVPTVAVFGSTEPRATAPLGPAVAVVREPVECSPCLQPECPRGKMICFTGVSADMVASAARGLLGEGGA